MTIQEISFKQGTYILNEQPNYNFQLNRVIQWDGGDPDKVITHECVIARTKEIVNLQWMF